MHAPERWPASDVETWGAWRDYLDRIEDPHVETLKREAEAELARIVRCTGSKRESRRPSLVPVAGEPRRGPTWVSVK